MTTGMYSDRTVLVRPLYDERELLMAERFYPGEFGWVIVLAIAGLLVYSLAIWGLVNDNDLNGLSQPLIASSSTDYGLDNSTMPGSTTLPNSTGQPPSNGAAY